MCSAPGSEPRKPRKPKGVKTAALQRLAVDTVERVRDGMRRYILTCIDPASRFGLAVALPSKATGHTQAALAAMLDLLPHKPKVLLSENEPQAKFQRSYNGSEFEAGFAQMLEDHGIARWYTYPQSPRMNAHAERFNRTVQKSFVDDHEDLLYTDPARFNRKLADWLVFYNSRRPHHSLGQKTPLSLLLEHQPECQRWWTYTAALQAEGGPGMMETQKDQMG